MAVLLILLLSRVTCSPAKQCFNADVWLVSGAQFVKDYSRQLRAAVITPATGLEGYVLPPSELADRVLATARHAAPGATLPGELGPGQMLIVIIHRKARLWALQAPQITELRRSEL